MTPRAFDNELIVVRVCPDRLAAEVIVSELTAQSVPAIVRGFGGIPGLEQGAEILVPAALVHRARWIIGRPAPTDDELTFLATGKLPGGSDSKG